MGALEDKRAELEEVKAQIAKAQKASEYRTGSLHVQRQLNQLYEKEKLLERQIAVLEHGSTRLATYINR